MTSFTNQDQSRGERGVEGQGLDQETGEISCAYKKPFYSPIQFSPEGLDQREMYHSHHSTNINQRIAQCKLSKQVGINSMYVWAR